jgi:glycosyltransferase involved in cell wall biosynthesis
LFDFNNSVFNTSILIPDTTKIVFVADLFAEDYVGGAELTSQALIDSSPVEIFKLRSSDVTIKILEAARDKFWIFGNFAQLNPQLIPSIVANLKYSILEYDYKYCKARSPERHMDLEKLPCDCHNQMNGKIISSFFYGAMSLWWMSEKQKERYTTLFPFLNERDNIVLSSVFDDKTLGYIKVLRSQNQQIQRKGWIVLGSKHWIKGYEDAVTWCDKNKKEYEVVWDLPYNVLLEKLSKAEGLVYLPRGGDTCPRMVIEAKLLGCNLQLNDYVQHKDEEWFNTDNIQEIEEYLYTARKTFWNGIKKAMDYKPTISGYTTTYNCVQQGYPFEQCIKSMLEFCDEVCVVDGGSTDKTWDKLVEFAAKTDKLKIIQVERDWSHPRHAVFDGMQKAAARLMCTKEFCWQMDSDEIVHEDDAKKINDLCRLIPREADILSLPVIEYWGGPEKVRMDVTPWKWRLSRNKKDITHGIPVELRKFDENGELYAAEGTDGCDMISLETGERLPHINFYTQDIENVRRVAMFGNEQAKQQYESWYNDVVFHLPCVFHYSWYDMPRKIRLYRDYWQNHWLGLYNKDTSDTSENNMMFDVPWSQVTDEMIESRAIELKTKLGGWIWHRKYDNISTTPHIKCYRTQPRIML